MMEWASSQLVSYSLLAWSLYLSITVVAAYFARAWGIIAGHIAIAFVIIWFDLQWIQTAMHAPGWNGTPDMDVVFHLGVWMRVLLINTVLLPLAFLTRWLSIRQIAGHQ